MVVEAKKETLGFQAEVQQLLDLMIHSLYSNKEIFLRELISNASDAADRLRFEALKEDGLYEDETELKIRVEYNKDNKTITVLDNGIGMSREDVVENLGTIAKSGTQEFFNSLTGDQNKDSQLIGQFGVGFYSSFIVAEKVEVTTRRAGAPRTEGVRWISAGADAFSGQTPIRKFSSIFNLPDFVISEIISSSIKPGSMVLSTITSEFGDKISASLEQTFVKVE